MSDLTGAKAVELRRSNITKIKWKNKKKIKFSVIDDFDR